VSRVVVVIVVEVEVEDEDVVVEAEESEDAEDVLERDPFLRVFASESESSEEVSSLSSESELTST